MALELEYTPALESAAAADLRPHYGPFVDGAAAPGQVPTALLSPATEEPLTEIAEAGPDDVDAAVAAARRAFDTVWGRLPGTERAKYLYRLARGVQDHSREFAVVQTLAAGVPVRRSRGEDAPLAAATLFHNAGWADKLRWALPGAGRDPRPLGVVAPVVSGRCPLLTVIRTVAPALACGNTVVIKPSGAATLIALHLAELCRQAELPPGVFNVVTGGAEPGRLLVGHSGVDAVTFAGSRASGRAVATALAGTGKLSTLDLGGAITEIVFDDAPMDQAVDAIVEGGFTGAGQPRTGTRLLVQESVAEEVLAAVRHRASRLRVGDPLDRNTDVGPVGSAEQAAAARDLVAGCAETERWSVPGELPQRGYWVAPTLLTGAVAAQLARTGEVCGPVLTVQTFRTPAEAVEKANTVPDGLAAGVWSEKGSRALAVAGRLRVGVVWANTTGRRDPAAPVGGYQESGYGSAGGRTGLEGYLAC